MAGRLQKAMKLQDCPEVLFIMSILVSPCFVCTGRNSERQFLIKNRHIFMILHSIEMPFLLW